MHIDFPRGRCCLCDQFGNGPRAGPSGRLCPVLPEGGGQTAQGVLLIIHVLQH